MEKQTVKDIFPQLVKNNGGVITLKINSKDGMKSRKMVVKCKKTIERTQQVHLVVGANKEILSIGAGTEVVDCTVLPLKDKKPKRNRAKDRKY